MISIPGSFHSGVRIPPLTYGNYNSISDIQKTLRSLLPQDYAKDYRRFRPADEGNMRLRVSRIRRWRHRKAKTTGRTQEHGSATPHLMTESQASGENHNVVLDKSSQIPSTINPSLLLRDSHTQPTIWNDANLPVVKPDLVESGKVAHDFGESSYKSPYASKMEVKASSEYDSEYGQHPTSQNAVQSSLPAHLRELGKRLQNVHSRSYIRRINSILRYSSTDSWRSSWSSLMSWTSSGKSKGSINQELPDLVGTQDENSATGPGAQNSPQLSVTEEIIWDELIDISKIAPAPSRSAIFEPILPTNRRCCHWRIGPSLYGQVVEDFKVCKACGLADEHYYAGLHAKSGLCYISTRNINIMDRFGNTPLHFSAASGKANLMTLLFWIRSGADIHARNTGGDTFMHVLNLESFADHSVLDHYETLVAYLLKRRFDFSLQNYSGRTIPKVFLESLERLPAKKFAPELIPQRLNSIISRMEIDLRFHNSCEKLLRNASVHCHHEISTPLSKAQAYVLLESYYKALLSGGSISAIRFDAMLREKGGIVEQRISLIHLVRDVRQAATVTDENGETLLMAVLRLWENKDDEILLQALVEGILEHGAEINIRDRKGHTALTIACCRGFRPAVKALLARGSNIHARNYHGQGILQQANSCLRRARSEPEEKTYAGIMSCMNLLIDAGCKWEPTTINEWSRPNWKNPFQRLKY